MLAVNILGGSAVIGSYILELATHPGAVESLWGGVSLRIRSYYSVGMILAAIGYLVFTYFLLFHFNPNTTKFFGNRGAQLFLFLYLGILIPSALWMPATFWAIEKQSIFLVWLVRIILVLVAISSLGMLLALRSIEPQGPTLAHTLAMIGSVCFCFQTVILDSIVWGISFRV